MDKIDELLTRGVENIYPSRQALKKVLRSGKKLRMYQGFDPSMPSLHLGNYVGLLKMRQFQDLGHEVIFLVGDFTGRIGDPTDKLATRKMLSSQETRKNSQSYQEQVARILNFSGANPVKMKFNSDWNDKLTFKDLIEICANFTVQQMIERDMFQERLKAGKPIHLHEFLYPVTQGYDSVFMEVDLELGGSDQTFNMLAGRTLLRALKGKEKFVMSTKLLVDAQGEKVGKTTGNALFFDRPANEFYGGLMAFPDEVLPLGFELLTQVPKGEVDSLDFSEKPMELKKRLAFEVVKIIYGEKAAREAQTNFEKVFQKRESPENPRQVTVKNKNWGADKLLLETGLVKSLSEAKRLLAQKAIELNGTIVTDQNLTISEGDLLRVGKTRFVRIKVL